MQLKGSSAQLGFLSRQPSPKITSSGSIHLPAERAPLGPDPAAFAVTKGLAFWVLDETAGLDFGSAGARSWTQLWGLGRGERRAQLPSAGMGALSVLRKGRRCSSAAAHPPATSLV